MSHFFRMALICHKHNHVAGIISCDIFLIKTELYKTQIFTLTHFQPMFHIYIMVENGLS